MTAREHALPCLVAKWAARTPDAVALRTAAGDLTWQEWHIRVTAAEAFLRNAGARQGTRVALQLPNNEATLTLLVALFRIGAVACPIDPKAPPAYRDVLLTRLACAVAITSEPRLTCAASGSPPPDACWQHDMPATLIFTSGSTGNPKAAALSLANHLACAEAANRNIPLAQEDTWLLSLPMHHVAGFGVLFRCLLAGASIALPGELPPAEAIPALRTTHVSLVARQLARLMDAQSLPPLKAILLGGSAIPGPLLDRAAEAGLPVHTSYGMTEMATQVTSTPPRATRATLATSGHPLIPGTIRIAPTGQIEVNGPARFLGYWEPRGLRSPFDRDGWFTTGDRGHFDAEGRLHVTGRVDNLFVAGGENIQPEEIEQALLQIPGITQAVVVPAPHPEFGATPTAFVECTSALTPDGIRGALNEHLPAFKIPRHIFPWPSAIVEGGMKPNRARFAEEATRLASNEPGDSKASNR